MTDIHNGVPYLQIVSPWVGTQPSVYRFAVAKTLSFSSVKISSSLEEEKILRGYLRPSPTRQPLEILRSYPREVPDFWRGSSTAVREPGASDILLGWNFCDGTVTMLGHDGEQEVTDAI